MPLFDLIFPECHLFALNSKPLLLGRVDNDHFTSYVIVLAGVCTALGKFLGGWLFDQFNFYHLMTVSIIGNIMGGFIFYLYAYDQFFIVISIILMNIFGNLNYFGLFWKLMIRWINCDHHCRLAHCGIWWKKRRLTLYDQRSFFLYGSSDFVPVGSYS
jgi:hypothetical protein